MNRLGVIDGIRCTGAAQMMLTRLADLLYSLCILFMVLEPPHGLSTWIGHYRRPVVEADWCVARHSHHPQSKSRSYVSTKNLMICRAIFLHPVERSVDTRLTRWCSRQPLLEKDNGAPAGGTLGVALKLCGRASQETFGASLLILAGSCWLYPAGGFRWMAEVALSSAVLIMWSGAGGGPLPPTRHLTGPAEPWCRLARLLNFSLPEARRCVSPIELATVGEQFPNAL